MLGWSVWVHDLHSQPITLSILGVKPPNVVYRIPLLLMSGKTENGVLPNAWWLLEAMPVSIPHLSTHNSVLVERAFTKLGVAFVKVVIFIWIRTLPLTPCSLALITLAEYLVAEAVLKRISSNNVAKKGPTLCFGVVQRVTMSQGEHDAYPQRTHPPKKMQKA